MQFNTKKDVYQDYTIGKEVGSGNYGAVKRAKANETDKTVAIKFIAKKNIKKTDVSHVREISIMKLCNHKNIIKYVDCYEDSRYYYIVMEYAKGGELFDYVINRGGLPEQDGKKVFLQILSAVEYLHGSLMISHKDLKLENILLCDRETLQIKLVDFGFANFVRVSLNDTFCGSPHYTAPEILQNNKYNGMKTDIWSLGVILYTLLSCKFPWGEKGEGKNKKLDLDSIVNIKYKMPGEIPEQAADLIRTILVPVDQRPVISEIKKHPWIADDVLENEFPKMEQVSSIDTIIVNKIVSLGFKVPDILMSVCDNLSEQENGVYHILLDRFYENGHGEIKEGNIIIELVEKIVNLGFDKQETLTAIYEKDGDSGEYKIYKVLVEKFYDDVDSKTKRRNSKRSVGSDVTPEQPKRVTAENHSLSVPDLQSNVKYSPPTERKQKYSPMTPKKARKKRISVTHLFSRKDKEGSSSG